MFGQFPEPCFGALGVVDDFGVVAVLGVVVVDLLVAAFARAALPPTTAAVRVRLRRAFWNRVGMCSLTSFRCCRKGVNRPSL